ncbi:hypothetical protein D6D13_08971 [Aureobasidium pullulans]|uniref:Uncharacterized protein n=1 Tax=Aureobasidium pullulans TaxID=5580 RepID=A0A4S9C6T4_AURPU|nr:hypothetical protein D6D13_08971 [Aureobasidium pullulans]
MSGVWSADLLGGSSSHVVPCGVVSERHGCTSTIHALTKSDVLLKPWRSAMLVKYTSRRVFGCGEAEIWCRNALVRRATAETKGHTEQRYGPSVASVVADMSNSATTRSTVDCNSRFIGADSVSLAPRVTRAQARVCRRETTGAWPKHLNVSANWQLREASQQHLVIALHGKRRLHTTLHQTLDCRRLVFLGRRPLAVSTYQSQDP